MLHLALLILTLSLSFPAHAAEITSDLTLACDTRAPHDRMSKAAGAGDRAGIEAIINAAMRSGECRRMYAGAKVRIEEAGWRYACVVPFGSAEPCRWIMSREVKP